MPELSDALVIGAGPAGLAAAACLRERGLNPIIVEKADTVGAVWRHHYDRLRLHTDRIHSGLPGFPMPKDYGRYPSRLDVIAYLEQYASRFRLQPRFGVEVLEVRREGELWRAEMNKQTFKTRAVVVATGWADFPYSPTWPGIETFGGDILHSTKYHNPTPFGGQRVLVVGFGNSGGEIALDLAEAGVEVALSVRGPVCILPRDLLGIPILALAIAQQRLPARLVDTLNAPIIRLAVGPIEKLGLKRAAKGPRQMVEEDGRIPLLDVGTLAMIRAGKIAVRPNIKTLAPKTVAFVDGRTEAFDAIILATGFRPDLRKLLPNAVDVLNAGGQPLVSGRPTASPGLFFCGAIVAPTGQFREIGIEARRIADAIVEVQSSQRASTTPTFRVGRS
jgi:cation diffusion facilitator CzcD-associated flavoprotein CzcO